MNYSKSVFYQAVNFIVIYKHGENFLNCFYNCRKFTSKTIFQDFIKSKKKKTGGNKIATSSIRN